MPSKKKKFNARFPPVKWTISTVISSNTYSNLTLLSLKARIKKIMQTDEDVGKVAAAVPVIICILNANIIFKIRLKFLGSAKTKLPLYRSYQPLFSVGPCDIGEKKIHGCCGLYCPSSRLNLNFLLMYF